MSNFGIDNILNQSRQRMLKFGPTMEQNDHMKNIMAYRGGFVQGK